MFFDIALIAYVTDRIFGEFKFIRHPVILMGDFITAFQNRFYRDSILRGFWLVFWLLAAVLALVTPISLIVNPWILGIIASTGIAGKMLYMSVKEVLSDPLSIRYLVSRDTENLSESDIHKAAIETYAENLSDGVIAPLFYLLVFGLVGLFLYKAVNTLDSMVGYRNEKYEKFGKVSARLDDIANFLPSRITAILILVLFGKLDQITQTWRYGALHESPNAGYPISAMALSLGLSLGGATSYFGKVKEKPYFGEGAMEITALDVRRALALQWKLDTLVILLLAARVYV
ncbi:MAG: cobalamin biosynthesis protein CobD [Sulfuricurvum sp. GWF2_44_89]|uniref:Cobalamin biosynthesis protein CobD n=1 Tax=Sulfuricurvum kujiense TaxID=148813 RepID=A0A2D3WDS2_9BACT|nr:MULTISPECIES: adenosylcobinamide-phosphate synthase CbiB [Sulfuricurvum]OHD78455.1 MAG: cobalamin biosynthesis protein CobD [Sulfuricurvum sp. GWF2_44_89]OHD93084.1 MAG: cobalamin biosynthesis protein CobD [Sulfuricurvum sp. RIFOXYD12_FULL_44_77]OHD95872.1 MAG: cobalamin biosynthesis protein CobD [Sulfuricurvum sp. RIFOXYD2_FULL_44_160]DAB39442.1 MAG TPA: cobalamin biosynthesis protein CobD [Sulfuricurvum kujiense]